MFRNMNWSSEFNEGLAFLSGGEFRNNFQYKDSADFQVKHAQEANLYNQREKDQDFINNFILNKQHHEKINLKNKSVKISAAKTLFQDLIYQKKIIEKEILSLDVNDENFDSKWKVIMVELNKISNQISEFDLDIKPYLLRVIEKRLKKRRAIKKRKMQFSVTKKLQQQKIQEKHKIIDKLLIERGEEVDMIKHEAALKRQADSVLHEVRKKKFEAKKILNLLVALSKLRELRSKEEEKIGGYCSKQLTETFNEVMARFKNLWEKQLEVYKLEEKGLKIMLEENTVPHRKVSKLETNVLQWEKALFGDFTVNDNNKLQTLPEHDIQVLIQIRRDWDQFLTTESTPMASSIPLGWVLPPETEDEQWKIFTEKSKTISLDN